MPTLIICASVGLMLLAIFAPFLSKYEDLLSGLGFLGYLLFFIGLFAQIVIENNFKDQAIIAGLNIGMDDAEVAIDRISEILGPDWRKDSVTALKSHDKTYAVHTYIHSPTGDSLSVLLINTYIPGDETSPGQNVTYRKLICLYNSHGVSSDNYDISDDMLHTIAANDDGTYHGYQAVVTDSLVYICSPDHDPQTLGISLHQKPALWQ